MSDDFWTADEVSRRAFLSRAGAGGVLLASSGGILAACGSVKKEKSAAGNTIKIGYVSPQTGPAAGFGESDKWLLGVVNDALKDGIKAGGKDYEVQVLVRDSQSNPQRAAAVASGLINKDHVDLMLASSTPESVNPVSDACEAAGVPCISTVVPWQAWYFGRGAKPDQMDAFKYTFHFSFGVENFAKSYISQWNLIPTNKTVGALYPNDSDGNAIRGAMIPILKKAGFKVIDPGPYEDGTNDYSAQIAKFKSANCQIFNTFPLPPDFATFWKQAAQQGYKPKIAQIAKTGLFPSQVEALGKLGPGLATAAFWHPVFPYKSSLTGMGGKEIQDSYEKTGKQWTQVCGTGIALFDAGIGALKAATNPKDRQAVTKAITTLKVDTPVGTLDWTKGPNKNVVDNVIPGAQWVKGSSKFPLDLKMTENADDKNIPVQAKLQPYGVDLILAAEKVHKQFGALVVLDGVDFAVQEGETVGIVGPNGAGKTTLLDVLAGAQAPTRGTVRLGGRDITSSRAAERCRLGIGRSHQVPRPFGGMTVFENVLVGATAGGKRRGSEAHDVCIDVLARTGLIGVANRRAEALGLLARKRLELARALATDPQVLLLDEIAGGLTDEETVELVQTIEDLRARGIAVVWIEHIVHVLVQVAERMICMAAGRVIADGTPEEVMNDAGVIEAYLGERAGMSVLEVHELTVRHGLLHAVREATFSVEQGETLALVGANGAGKTSLLRAIAGATPAAGGRIVFEGEDVTAAPAYRRARKGIALVPEGRRLFADLTVRENLVVARDHARGGEWDVDALVHAFPLLRDRLSARAGNLSGGEQQATAIARALITNPRLLLLDEVSLGLAPVAVEDVYRSLHTVIERGTTIVLVEQDLGRALEMADRVLCMLEGRIVLAGDARELSREDVTDAYFGLRR